MQITSEETAQVRPKTVYECMCQHRDMTLLDAISHTHACVKPRGMHDLKQLRKVYALYLDAVMRKMTKPNKHAPIDSFCESRTLREQRELAKEVGL